MQIVNDLREAIQALGEHRIVAVDEQKHSAVSWWVHRKLGVQRLNELFITVEIRFVAYDKIDLRVARWRCRPFDLAVDMLRRNRDNNSCVIDGICSLAIEKRAWPAISLTCRRDEHCVIVSASHTLGDRDEKTTLGSGRARYQRCGGKQYRKN